MAKGGFAKQSGDWSNYHCKETIFDRQLWEGRIP